jgi:hypothetical protein
MTDYSAVLRLLRARVARNLLLMNRVGLYGSPFQTTK